MKKQINLSITLLAILILNSCKTTIPQNDRTPPTAAITVIDADASKTWEYETGDGTLIVPGPVGKKLVVMISGKDKGGVSELDVTIDGVTHNGTLNIKGNKSNPLDALFTRPTLSALRRGQIVKISARVDDFKGNKLRPNTPQVIITGGVMTPFIKLSASKTDLKEGESFTLSWNTDLMTTLNFTNPSLAGRTLNVKQGNITLKADLSISEYTLSGTSKLGNKVTKSVKVKVTKKPVPICSVINGVSLRNIQSGRIVVPTNLISTRLKKETVKPNAFQSHPNSLYAMNVIRYQEWQANTPNTAKADNYDYERILLFDLQNCRIDRRIAIPTQFNSILSNRWTRGEYIQVEFGKGNTLITLYKREPISKNSNKDFKYGTQVKDLSNTYPNYGTGDFGKGAEHHPINGQNISMKRDKSSAAVLISTRSASSSSLSTYKLYIYDLVRPSNRPRVFTLGGGGYYKDVTVTRNGDRLSFSGKTRNNSLPIQLGSTTL